MENEMAADTAPAAVPDPTTPPQAAAPTGPAPQGWLASVLAPVAPARPLTDPASPHAADTAPETGHTAVPGASSASFHGDDQTATEGKTATATRQERSVLRAWLLAGAQRWAKGGGTANKRLDTQKAKAQARQVKTTRTETVNRSVGGPAAGNSGGRNAGGGGVDR
ncbi:hypothetical protein ACFWUV_26705, partial [Streptomyces sp. NPDC058657]